MNIHAVVLPLQLHSGYILITQTKPVFPFGSCDLFLYKPTQNVNTATVNAPVTGAATASFMLSLLILVYGVTVDIRKAGALCALASFRPVSFYKMSWDVFDKQEVLQETECQHICLHKRLYSHRNPRM